MIASESFTLEEIGERFGRLLSQDFALEITQNKRIADLEKQNNLLAAEVECLRQELREAQTDLLQAQGNLTIARAKGG